MNAVMPTILAVAACSDEAHTQQMNTSIEMRGNVVKVDSPLRSMG